ncbi:MAG: AI-2E family transporter [Nitrosarchaeum sp.]|nr:AI-2E family transporter [Nitrosarchaeum sp.]
MLILVILLIVIPASFIIVTLVDQAQGFFINFRDDVYAGHLRNLPFVKDQAEDVQNWLIEAQLNLKHTIVDGAVNLLGSAMDVAVGLFVMFFFMFYFFKDGRRLYYYFFDNIPLPKKYKEGISSELRVIVQGVLYGQVFTSIIQGILGGIILAIFGIPNAIFWAFLMIIAAFLPYVGTFIIWGPALLWMSTNQTEPYSNISLILFFLLNAGLVGNIDNVLRPYLIGRKSKLHAGLVLLGVLGGLQAFGLAGMIIGPIIFALLLVIARLLFSDDDDITPSA